LGTLLDKNGQFPKAEEELKTAIGLKPDFHMALNYLGYSYAERNIKLDEAEKLLNDAIAFSPDNPAYLDSMGWVYYRQGKLKKAIDFLLESSKQADDPLIYEHLGDAYSADGDVVDAIVAWDNSVRLSPENNPVRKKIAKALGKISKKDKFGVFMKRAVADYSGLASMKGLVKISVCQPKPCFDSKAQFSYASKDKLEVEIPGPLSGPAMLLTKKHGSRAKYGAIHPQFQTIESDVTRAFDRIESVLSGDAFLKFDLSKANSPSEKSGVLSSVVEGTTVQFDAESGEVKQLDWQDAKAADRLKFGPAGAAKDSTVPKYFEWQDVRSGFTIRIDFLNPAVTAVGSDATPNP
jgi:tetratricopeptide (TPR) repeat protein